MSRDASVGYARSWFRRTRSLVAVGLLVAAPLSSAAERVTVTLTEHGIPHVRATSFRGLGYGYGYAMARNDACGMADMFLTFSGRRAEVLGEAGHDLDRLIGRRPIENVANDFVRRYLVGEAQLSAAKAALSPPLRDLVKGYAAGFTRYVKDTPATGLPAACRDIGSVRPVTDDDVLRRVAGGTRLLSSGVVLAELYAAVPPDAAASPKSTAALDPPPRIERPGSNAYAFGKAVTDNGSGLLLGNPHFYWDGPDRFVEVHLTIPGVYDAMGVSLLGFPLVSIGFTNAIAWSHTVSTDKRGVIYQLKLDPRDATRYVVDGRSLPMKRVRVSVPVTTSDHRRAVRTHDFWETIYGPMLGGPAFPWTRESAYALADFNADNHRMLAQGLEIATSRDVGEIKARLERTVGMPWINTIAVDRDGRALYADVSVTPNVATELLARCERPFPSPFASLLMTLDGTTRACLAPNDPAAPQHGIMRGSAKPALIREDFVENSNDSHWLVNPAALLEGFSPVVGAERTPRNFRTRQAMVQVEDRLAGQDGLEGRRMTQGDLEKILLSGRSMQADFVVGALVSWCEKVPDDDEFAALLWRACAALRVWDRHYTVASRGAHFFREFALAVNAAAGGRGGEDLSTVDSLWSIPFDAKDPVHTPRGFRAGEPSVRAALISAAKRVEGAGLSLDAPLGDVQYVERLGRRIPIGGGATFSAMHLTLSPKRGYTDPFGPSNSYIQVVTFDGSGPVADAILGSSQSPDEGSPYFMDQTALFGRGEWIRLPFSEKAIEAARVGPPLELAVEGVR